MELWTEVRRRVLTGEIGKRAACRQYQLHWQTLEKIRGHVEPPGYRTARLRQRPKMEPFLPLIAEILEADQRAPKKQRQRPSGCSTGWSPSTPSAARTRA